jgi:putative thioredoxin
MRRSTSRSSSISGRCGSCKQLGPILEKAVRAANGAVRMVKLNIDENPEVAQQMRIQSIPAV